MKCAFRGARQFTYWLELKRFVNCLLPSSRVKGGTLARGLPWACGGRAAEAPPAAHRRAGLSMAAGASSLGVPRCPWCLGRVAVGLS